MQYVQSWSWRLKVTQRPNVTSDYQIYMWLPISVLEYQKPYDTPSVGYCSLNLYGIDFDFARLSQLSVLELHVWFSDIVLW